MVCRRFYALLAVLCTGCWTSPAQHVYTIDNHVRAIAPVMAIHGQRGVERFWTIALSPDGNQLLTTEPPTIRALKQEMARRVLTGYSGRVRAVAWSHDGKSIALCSGYELDICNAETGEQIKHLEQNADVTPAGVAFSPDDSWVVWLRSVREQMELAAFSLKSGETIVVPGPPREEPGFAWIHTLNQVPIFISTDNTKVYCRAGAWQLETTPRLNLTRVRQFAMPMMAVSPDLRYGYGVDHLYEVDPLPLIRIPLIFVRSGFSDNPADSSQAVALFQIDLLTGAIVARREFTHAHQYPQKPSDANIYMATNCAATSPDGTRLALGTLNGIHVLDLRENKDVGQLLYNADFLDKGQIISPGQSFTNVAFSPDGRQIFGSEVLKGCFVWDLP